MLKQWFAAACVWAWVFSPVVFAASTEPTFASVFGDHMVVQRGQPIKVWGQGNPGQKLTVRFAGQKRKAKVGKQGAWSVTFKPALAGGPYQLTATTKAGASIAVKDVLVGDVWLCSGQSNMAWPVSKTSGAKPWAGKAPSDVRLLSIPRTANVAPQNQLPEGTVWALATEQNLEAFSALCSLFSEQIKPEVNVPMGLIQSAWGGSQIEAWLSQKSLSAVEGFDDRLALLNQYQTDIKGAEQAYGKTWMTWWQNQTAPWQGEYAFNWLPMPHWGDWKAYGDPDLSQHHGLVWFETTFELTQAQAAKGAQIYLGGIDEVDLAWVNGHLVGTEFGWGTPREYPVAKSQLKTGKNTVVVNVLNTWGSGGMIGPGKDVRLVLGSGEAIPLAKGWRYSRVPSHYGYPPSAPWQSIKGLTTLKNAMVAPLYGLNIAGVIWYQGESNTGRANAYAPLLKGLIKDWREVFGKALPVIIVQLPNFGQDAPSASGSGWAQLRHAQWLAVKDDRFAGLVPTIDVGDPKDIHPTDKTAVAKRAAQVALSLPSKGQDTTDGIAPKHVAITAEYFALSFSPAGEALKVKGGGVDLR